MRSGRPTDHGALVRRIRTSAEAVLLSLVAEKATRVIGHAMFSYLGLDGSDAIFRRVALLAPLAVQPEMQGYGVGSALVRQGIERLEARGEPVVIVRGDLRYYGRFGFRPAVDLDINAPSLSPGITTSPGRCASMSRATEGWCGIRRRSAPLAIP